MKKFYVIFFLVLLGFVQKASSQNYTAQFTGFWSDNSIWGASGIPSNPCTNCTITINDGVSVTLDISFKMLGSSKVLIGSAGAFASSLTIPTTNASSIFTGHNLILSNLSGGNPTVKIVSALSSLNVTQGPGTSGIYDGVFVQNPSDFGYFKIVGLQPLLVSSDGVTTSLPFAPMYGTSLPNSAHPAPFTLNSDGTLPVILGNFSGAVDGKVIDLSWTTEIEINSDHFDIQRSADAAVWQSIGTMQAKGNSGLSVNYAFTDRDPLRDNNFYRLKMADKDGQFKYSPVISVQAPLLHGLKIFPNPASNYLTVSIGTDITADFTIKLMNQFGQVLQTRKMSHAAGTTVTLPVQSYPQGTYILQFVGTDGKMQSNKVLVAR